jgi:hypothetical protein
MKKNTIIKKIDYFEDKISSAIEEFRDFLDATEDPDLSSMGDDFAETMIDFMHENDICKLNDIRGFAQNELE